MKIIVTISLCIYFTVSLWVSDLRPLAVACLCHTGIPRWTMLCLTPPDQLCGVSSSLEMVMDKYWRDHSGISKRLFLGIVLQEKLEQVGSYWTSYFLCFNHDQLSLQIFYHTHRFNGHFYFWKTNHSIKFCVSGINHISNY